MSTVNSTAASDVIARLQKNTAASTSKTTDAQSNFLKLLTEQLKNQDPLSPMDNAQMTSQLAQISTVDGIEKLNTTLTAMLSGSQSGEADGLDRIHVEVRGRVTLVGDERRREFVDAGRIGAAQRGGKIDQLRHGHFQRRR